MARRMYSESQLGKIVDAKLAGYDSSIPTDVVGDAQQNLHLVHDGNKIGEGTYVSKVFGKDILSTSPSGNIEVYDHYITLETANSALSQYSGTLILRVVSSSNIPVNSLPDLNTLLRNTEKTIDCSGFFTRTAEGKTFNIFKIDWKGTVATSMFGYIGSGLAEDEGMSIFTTATDVVETI